MQRRAARAIARKIGISGGVNRGAVAKEFATRLVAGSGRLELGRCGQNRADRHLVQGERAGLVRADRRHRAQGLDRGKAANDGVAIRHPLDADGERDRHHRGQAFGNGGDGDPDRGHERMLDFVAARHEGKDADAGGERQNDNRQALGEDVHLTQERRGQRFDAPDHGADAPKLGRGAGRDHQPRALPARDHRAGIGHRGAVAERCVGRDGIDRLVGRGRFAGQHGLLDLEARGAQEPQVGGNAVAGFGQHDVADHEAFGGNGQSPPVAQDRGLAREHRADGLERLFRPPFLDEPDRSR